jgi:flagellar basal-body rod protein FlgB
LLDLALTALASRQADWLAVRQKTISDNIAQSDTPGYQARDVRPFADVLNRVSGLATTSPRHIALDETSGAAVNTKTADSWDVKHSGNTVSLDQQLLKANEVRSAYSLNVGIVRAFNRMILASVKG